MSGYSGLEERVPDPFSNINRRKDKRGRPLELFHIEEFNKIKKDDEVSFNIVDEATGERTELRHGKVISKYPSMLQFDVIESPGDTMSVVVNVEEIHDSFSTQKE
jgi:hypothetical protein